MDGARVDGLGERIRGRREDLVALTQDLIRIPTINPPGDAYTACCDYLRRRLAARGFDCALIRGDGAPGDSDRFPRTNIVARWDSGRPGPTVHFNSHIDVVEVGPGWTVEPFGGLLRDGKIYGRGACDMKGGLAASIIAVEALIDSGLPLVGALEISGTVDEETGGYGGVAYLAERGFFSPPRVDHVIIPEPLNVDRICLGHRGVWWAEIETRGRIAHGSMPFLGDSAIRHMGAFLHALEDELYPKLAARRTAMPVAPEGARASTLNINSLHGGLDEGFDGFPSAVVAHSCRIVLDRRYLIEETVEEVRGEVVDLLDRLARERPGFAYALKELWTVSPTMTDRDAPVVRAVGAEIERVLGKKPEPVVSPGTYDQKHVARLGRLRDCIAYGPGILDLAHQPDEYVEVEAMLQSAHVMAAAAYRLLTGDLPSGSPF